MILLKSNYLCFLFCLIFLSKQSFAQYEYTNHEIGSEFSWDYLIEDTINYDIMEKYVYRDNQYELYFTVSSNRDSINSYLIKKLYDNKFVLHELDTSFYSDNFDYKLKSKTYSFYKNTKSIYIVDFIYDKNVLIGGNAINVLPDDTVFLKPKLVSDTFNFFEGSSVKPCGCDIREINRYTKISEMDSIKCFKNYQGYYNYKQDIYSSIYCLKNRKLIIEKKKNLYNSLSNVYEYLPNGRISSIDVEIDYFHPETIPIYDKTFIKSVKIIFDYSDKNKFLATAYNGDDIYFQYVFEKTSKFEYKLSYKNFYREEDNFYNLYKTH